jgi:hypothetical protein
VKEEVIIQVAADICAYTRSNNTTLLFCRLLTEEHVLEVSGACQDGLNGVYVLDLLEPFIEEGRPHYVNTKGNHLYWTDHDGNRRWLFDSDFSPEDTKAYFDSAAVAPPHGSSWRMWCDKDGTNWEWEDVSLSIIPLSVAAGRGVCMYG